MKSAIFCRYCGTELLEDAIFCQNCGEPQKDPGVSAQQLSSPVIEPSAPATPDPLTDSQPVLPDKQNPTSHLSRRTIVLGLAGTAIVAIVGGSVTWAALSGKLHLPFLKANPAAPPPFPANSNTAMFGYDVQHTRFNPSEHLLNPANVSHLVPYWTFSTGDSIYSSPAVSNGIVYVGSYDSRLYALNAKTGSMLWTYTTRGLIHSSLTVVNGVVYIGSDDGRLYAFHLPH